MVYHPPVARYNTSVKDSFAYDTAVRRWPAILTQVVDAMYRECHRHSQNNASEEVDEGKAIIEKISELKYELTHDRALSTLDVTKENAVQLSSGFHAPTTEAYDQVIRDEQPKWFQSEWLFAECYLYRRLRLLFERSKHWKSYDPFAENKVDTFRASGAGIHACAVLIEELMAKSPTHSAHDPAVQVLFDELMASSLWGNATDLSLLTNLSYADIQKLQAANAEQRKEKEQYVLVNQLDEAYDAVRAMDNGRIDIVLDNAGFELVTDMLLADWLLTLRGTIPRASEERAKDVQARLASVRARVSEATKAASHTSEPRLLAVSKLQPPSDIMAAFDAGQRHFGENYAQELVDKARVLPQSIKWHLVGGLQSNKAKILGAVPNLYAVESVDSEKLATNLEKALARPENELRRTYPLHVYLQVNTSGEEGKSGVPALTSPWDGSGDVPPLVALARHVLLSCPHLRLTGLMTIGALSNSTASATDKQNPDFEALVASRTHLLDSLRSDQSLHERLEKAEWWTPSGPASGVYASLFFEAPDALELSMGMSADLESAVAHGSAHVRIGNDCFGPRTNTHDAAQVREAEIKRFADVPLVKQVVFHTKNMPWFVSDTCVPDVWYTLEKLQDPAFFAEAKLPSTKPIEAMAARWAAHFADGSFHLQMPHDAPLGSDAGDLSNFWTAPASFGALNYRKLTQDAEWPADTPFTTALGPLAGEIPLLALRTCKAEVCVGLAPGQAAALDQRDPKWRGNGHWAGKWNC